MKNLCKWFFTAFTCAALLVSCHAPTSNGKADSLTETPELKKASDKIADDPKNAALYYVRGNLLHKQQKDTLALKDYKRAISIDSSKAEYYSAVGNLMFDHKDITGSLPYIQKAIALNPNDPRARIKVAKLFVFIKEYDKAFAELNTVLRQNVHDPEPYYLKGLIYRDLKDTAHSISSFLTSIQEGPEFRESYVQLGQLYSTKHDPIALRYFKAAFKLDTTDLFPLYATGMYYQEKKDYEQAKAEYRDCIIRDNQYSKAFMATGYILLQQDSFAKAWRQYNTVTQIEPNSAIAYYSRGLCSELMKNNKDAINDYKQALVFNSKYADAQEGLKRLGAQ